MTYQWVPIIASVVSVVVTAGFYWVGITLQRTARKKPTEAEKS